MLTMEMLVDQGRRIGATLALAGLAAGCADREPMIARDEATLQALPRSAAAAVANSRVPVLVPRRPELLAHGIVLTEPQWSSFYAQADGITVSVMGKRLAHTVRGVEPAPGNRLIRGKRGFITQSEGVWSATWSERGTTYTVDVECAEPTEARCQDDAYLRALTDDLAFVGGAGAGR